MDLRNEHPGRSPPETEEKPLKVILHAFKDYCPPTRGGVEQHVREVVHSVEGFKFTVLTSSRGKLSITEDDKDVKVIRSPEYWRPVSTPVTPAWPKLLRDSEADIAHFHMPNPFGELCYLKAGKPADMVATYHADIIGRRALLPFFTPFQQAFLYRANRVIVSNPKLLETSPALHKHRRRVEVIPFGVDAADWSKQPSATDRLRENYQGPVVLFLGRLAYYKGIDVLIKAMTQVEATCLIAGTGPKEQELENSVSSAGISDRVRFLGDIPDSDRAAYYHLADVFVLPSTSRAESFGIAMLEALACGTPAISTELGTGTSWVNQNNSTGLVVPPNNAGALAHALQRLLADEALRRDMGAAAAARAKEHFSRDAMIASLTQVYSSI